jgi:D-alanyl-D-alanine carboxypeptidase/D-alanyl-D-alanine-endopeptidase (penicillin-binding protein 4)
LQRSGIRIAGPTELGFNGTVGREESGGAGSSSTRGEALLAHYSQPLIQTLLYQNAHSSNAIAEVVGQSVGGPAAIREFLVKEVGLRYEDIYVGRASGLEFNRITPRASLTVLRALMAVLSKHSLKLEDVMPVAGIDGGTLRTRFDEANIRGSVVAKTGTLVTIDNGVSNLVGIAYTRAHGPLAFAIFNSGGGVHAYRRLQDQFLSKVIEEEGGGIPSTYMIDRLTPTEAPDRVATHQRETFTLPVIKPAFR